MYNFLIILKFRRLDGSLRLDRLGKKLLIVQIILNILGIIRFERLRKK